MYQLNFGDYTIYDPRMEELCMRSAKVKLAVDEAGSFTFTLDHDHPYIDQLTRLKGRLELLSDGVPVFRGRLLSDVQEFDLSREFEAEGQLACLNDSLVAPFDFPTDVQDDEGYIAAAESGNVVEWWLSQLLDSHNAQVTTEQQIKLGTVTVQDANNYIARSSEDYATTWETLTGKLTGSSLGGHFLVRYESDGTYLDYLADYPLSNTQSIEYAENLMDLSDEIDAAELYTAILPVGSDGLTIAELEDGALTEDLVKEGDIIYSKAAVEKYGRITSLQTWDDVTVATNLQSKAKALLAQSGILPNRTISVTAVDLHWTDEDVAQLRVGRYTPIVSAPHDLDARYVLSELELNILDPGSSQVTLGATIQTATDRNQSAVGKLEEKDDKQQIEIDGISSSITELAQTTQKQITEVVQSSQEIILKALEEYATTTDLTHLQEQVSAQLAIMSDHITATITSTTERIDNVDGDLQSKYNTITKYFKFTTDGLTIGQEDNDLNLKLDNDRVSFLDGGLEVAYISDKKLYITDAEITNSLRIGKFAWVPRNSGNLSLVKVGD